MTVRDTSTGRFCFCIKTMGRPNRPDREGIHKSQFDKNRRIILLTQDYCGICGKPVDKSLKWPHPLSPTVDHIIPVDKGGHPSDIANLQLAHFTCNRWKSDKMVDSKPQPTTPNVISNRILPQSRSWIDYSPAPRTG